MKLQQVLGLMMLSLAMAGCPPTSNETTMLSSAPLTKEALFGKGHLFYGQLQFDSATVYLTQAVRHDSLYADPIVDLAALHYDLAMQNNTGASEAAGLFRLSRDYYDRADKLGWQDSELLERLCDISVRLDDQPSFLRYAKKNAKKYPYDRQYSNLGLAYVEAGEYQEGIKFLKSAIEKFPNSTYIGSYYRQLGRAYYKVDRHQTAERTFYDGLKAVDTKLMELEKLASPSSVSQERLRDDKIGMLVTLKGLHLLYKDGEKLANVEKQLKELGYTK